MFTMFDYEFMRNAFYACTIVGIVAGAVGYFLVLRGQTFAGHALAHVGFPGATGAGLIVLISEDDLREIVSVGRTRMAAAKEPAAGTWFAPFNSTAPTVEWRAADGKPFAIIQRWHLADHSEPDKEDRPTTKAMLAVTRLPPGAVCHVAYVDAQANPNPNELARKAADDLARNFKCGKDEVKVIGETGRAVSMAKR